MKFIVSNIGSRGDIQPYIALAKQLVRSGHKAAIATHPYAKQLTESFGVEHIPVGRDISVEDEVQKVLSKSQTPTKGLHQAIHFIIENLHNCHNDLMCAINDADAVIVGHNLAGQVEAELLNKPYIRVIIDESGVPKLKPPFFSKHYFQGLLASFWASAFLKPYNQYRKTLHLPVLDKSNAAPKLTLLPITKELQSYNDLWFPNTEITGYWFMDTPTEFKPDAKLLEFIRNGSKPIFFSLGSMYANLNQMKQMFDLFISASIQCKERAIILMPIDVKHKLPNHIFHVKTIPYSWLFDKVSVAAHHCGFGTTAEVLKAGLPTIPIPHIFDQFKTAGKLYKSGLACKPLNIHKLSIESLSQAISEIKNDKQIVERTKNIGSNIRQERGVEKAVELIFKHLLTNSDPRHT